MKELDELEKIVNGDVQRSKGSIIWTITKLFSKCTWFGTKFVVKNTPAALGMAWEVKKEISNEIALSIQEVRKEQKILELENEIKALNNPQDKLIDKLIQER